MLTCKIAETEKEIIDNLLIRNEVFCIEQNISKEEEFDGLDELSTLFVLYLESNPIGAARLRILDDFTWKIERLSILKEYRNKSYGSFLLNYLENYIKSLNFLYF
jgi:GNAT superfamily N-acetyltransferase